MGKSIETDFPISFVYLMSLVSTKKSYEHFEIIEIQFVIAYFGAQRFEITFAV